jgi:hypothetical protein
MTRLASPAAIVNYRRTFSPGGCYIKTMTASVELIKNSGRESQGAGRQDEVIGSKSPIVK